MTFVVYIVLAATYGILALKVVASRRNHRLAAAAAITAAWGATVASGLRLQDALWFCATAAWAAVIDDLDRKFVASAPPGGLGLARIVAALGLLLAVLAAAGDWLDRPATLAAMIEARLVIALAILIACENVYRNAEQEIRWHLNLPFVAIATMQVFAMLLYGDAVLHGRLSLTLFEAQAVVCLMVLPLFAAAERRLQRWRKGVTLSHGAVFYTASLVLGGCFLLGLGLVGTLLRNYGESWGAVVQTALLFLGIIVVAVLAGSGSARSRLRQAVVNNFFTQRFDYRREWLRCIETLAAIDRAGLAQRVVKVVADTVDSPAGVLLLRDEKAESLTLVVDGEWNMRAPVRRINHMHRLLERLGAETFCLVEPGDDLDFPTTPRAWLAVSLPDPRSSAPLGIVIVAPPRAGVALDREAAALLNVVAREISLMLAERRAAEALNEARRFAAAGQRFTFVAHDIKNIANQLALLVDNADHHMADPEFQTDMMLTLRSSVAKIQTMLARLKAPDAVVPERLDVEARLRGFATLAWARSRIPVELALVGVPCIIAMQENAFDTVLNHLVDNAVDASAPGQMVTIAVRHDGGVVSITITDRGVGMTESFVRDEMFSPFLSSKTDGFGIGAFQARELIHAAGGTMAVVSAPGEGTTVRLGFPLSDCVELTLLAQEVA